MDKTLVVNSAEIRSMLRSQAFQGVCLQEAQKVAQAAQGMSRRQGAVFTATVQAGANRAQARVIPGNAEAWVDTLEHNTLLKAAG